MDEIKQPDPRRLVARTRQAREEGHESRMPEPEVRRSTRVEIHKHAEIGPLAGDWDALADRTGASPWVRPGWIEAWWDGFGRGRLQIVTVRRDGRLVGVAPMYRRRGVLGSTTNWHSPEFGFVAEDKDALEQLVRAVFEGRPRRVSVAFLDESEPELDVLRVVAERIGYRTIVRTIEHSLYLATDGGWDAYERDLSKHLRKELRRRRRRLEEAGSVAFEVHDGRSRLDELLEEGFAVEAAGWKGAGKTAIISRPETRRVYRELARWAAGRGWLSLAFLRLDGRPVAFRLDLQQGGVHYFLKGGYDEDYRDFSPAELLRYELLRQVFSDGVTRCEFIGQAESYKQRWARSPRERSLMHAFAPSPPGMLDWIAFAHGRPLARRIVQAWHVLASRLPSHDAR